MISTRTARLISILPEKLVRRIADKVLDGYMKRNANIIIEGLDNVKNAKKPVIYVCNHLSNADALVLKRVLQKYDSPTFVAGVKLSQNVITNLALGTCKTTNIKPNSPDKDGLKRIIELVKGGESIVIFPEGTRSREKKLIEAKKGVLLIAKMAKAQIIPIGMVGTEILYPINESGDMSAEEFHKADVHVKIGKPFELPKKAEDEDRKSYEERAIRHIMYNIAELLPEKYRGIYSK
ncbi:1-acyl-sn-glycerol-3-phosphate acyltransferase [Hathewaya proteolytica DSM 3090]|uniref:1-acyl-sn-glycerol-3-phosphate acyltransferase n=1 Tax=Hathewaya proteolytica DSM 3090 TaxID=1121331 RepID=A0A1M6RNJ8_9CLOT|nr:lysophospholipid acyltransferase family protein [Hathewaya proteolytica]SHK34035.1 1-acyl-sn-glycerol-3-phosphate acyltransferase [Hathewaya proteolytica DSM 3090]